MSDNHLCVPLFAELLFLFFGQEPHGHAQQVVVVGPAAVLFFFSFLLFLLQLLLVLKGTKKKVKNFERVCFPEPEYLTTSYLILSLFPSFDRVGVVAHFLKHLNEFLFRLVLYKKTFFFVKECFEGCYKKKKSSNLLLKITLSVIFYAVKIQNEPLTDDQGSLNFLQDEAGLVWKFGALCPEHADQPVLSENVVLHPQLKEISEDILHRLILLQAAHVVKQNLGGKKKLNVSDCLQTDEASYKQCDLIS